MRALTRMESTRAAVVARRLRSRKDPSDSSAAAAHSGWRPRKKALTLGELAEFLDGKSAAKNRHAVLDRVQHIHLTLGRRGAASRVNLG